MIQTVVLDHVKAQVAPLFLGQECHPFDLRDLPPLGLELPLEGLKVVLGVLAWHRAFQPNARQMCHVGKVVLQSLLGVRRRHLGVSGRQQLPARRKAGGNLRQ
jgi:hypothetical protein